MSPRRSGRRRPALVTLTSDFGWAYAAQVKGTLLRWNPQLRPVDLTHDLPRHRIADAAFVLRAIASTFPAGTVHLAVVDPGVGGRRAALAVRCRDGSTLVGPDNGVLAPLAERLGRPTAYALDPSRWAAPERVGTTFDGRDVFAPAAAQIAGGTPLGRLGVRAPFRILRLPEPKRLAGGALGEVAHLDHFGNVVTNVPSEWVPPKIARIDVSVAGGRSRRVPRARSYEALGRGRLGVLGSSFGTLELSVASGDAARRLRSPTGASVRFRWVAARAVH